MALFGVAVICFVYIALILSLKQALVLVTVNLAMCCEMSYTVIHELIEVDIYICTFCVVKFIGNPHARV